MVSFNMLGQKLENHSGARLYNIDKFEETLSNNPGVQSSNGTCTPEIFNRLFKVDNREQKQILLAHRRSRRKVPYSAYWKRYGQSCMLGWLMAWRQIKGLNDVRVTFGEKYTVTKHLARPFPKG